MEAINDFLSNLIPLTEWPMFILLIGGGLFLVFYSRFLPYRFFGHAIAITAGKYDDKNARGEVSSFQALSAAVAATVGLGPTVCGSGEPNRATIHAATDFDQDKYIRHMHRTTIMDDRAPY